jgi:transcriptional regulator with XRE-family HTH domain
MFVSHAPYLREKARQMRVEKRLTLDEIAERLALPKTTVWYWIADLPRPEFTRRQIAAQRRAATHVTAKYKRLRDEAYAVGQAEYARLCMDPSFRDFICLYIAEGYKRNRNTVSIANSDAAVIVIGDRWIRRFTRRKVIYSVQYHADQDLGEICRFWASTLAIESSAIKLQRKSNSNQLTGRTWRSVHGVLTVTTNDTLFRACLQAWMDCIRSEWL